MTRRAQVQQPSMFAEPPKPPAPLPVRLCACGAVGCYGLGPPAVPAQNERWWCRRCVPAGFLPKDRAA